MNTSDYSAKPSRKQACVLQPTTAEEVKRMLELQQERMGFVLVDIEILQSQDSITDAEARELLKLTQSIERRLRQVTRAIRKHGARFEGHAP